MARICVILIAMMLAGCGDINWLPKDEVTVERQDAGLFVSSESLGNKRALTKTTTRAFITYTTVLAFKDIPCWVDVYREPIYNGVMGRVFRVSTNTVLIESEEGK